MAGSPRETRATRPLLILTVLLSATLVLAAAHTAGEAEEEDVYLLEYSFTSRTGGPVYPGSSEAQLTIELSNAGDRDLEAIACITLPPGFSAEDNCRDIIVFANTSREIVFVIDVSDRVEPGVYAATLKLSYDNTSRDYTLILLVSEYPEPQLEPVIAWVEANNTPAYQASLHIVVVNKGNTSISRAYAYIVLPEAFEPSRALVEVGRIEPGDIGEIVVEGLKLASPGEYTVEARLTVYAETSDGVRYWYNKTLRATIVVGGPASPHLRVVLAEWSRGGYPSSIGSSLELLIQNQGPCTVEQAAIILSPPDGVDLPPLYTLGSPLQPGQLAVARITANIGSISPGAYSIGAKVVEVLSCRGGRTTIAWRTSIDIVVAEPPRQLVVLDYGLRGLIQGTPAKPVLYITLLNNGSDTVQRAYIEVEVSGEKYFEAITQPLQPWTTTTLEIGLRRAELPSTAHISITAVQDSDGAEYRVVYEYTLQLREGAPTTLLEVVSVRAFAGNQPAPILPGQENLELRLRIVNKYTETIRVLDAWLDTPILRVKDASGCDTVSPGDSCTLRLTVDVDDNAEPGLHNATLTVYVSVGDEAWLTKTVHEVVVAVAPLEEYLPKPVVAGYWWTWSTQASEPYPGRVLQLNILVYNKARYGADNVVAELGVEGLDLLRSTSTCQGLSGGDTCTLSFMVDATNAEPGVYAGSVTITTVYKGYNVFAQATRQYSLDLVLPSVEEGGLELVDTGWAEGRRAYPGSENAEYAVVLANKLPYTLAGVEVELSSPATGTAKAYAPGPIEPFAVVQQRLRLDVDPAVQPGEYNATLHVRYWTGENGVYTLHEETLHAKLVVSDPREAYEPITVYWAGPAPGPSTSRAVLVIVYRVHDATASSPVLQLELPEGLLSLQTGTRRVNVTPATTPIQGQQPPQALPAQLLQALQQASPAQRLIVFTVPVSVDEGVEPGTTLVLRATVSFLDAWGSRQQAAHQVEVLVPGASTPVRVWSEPRTLLANGTATLRLHVENTGSALMRDVYVILAPTAPSAYPANPIQYVASLGPGEEKILEYTLVFNPAGYAGSKTHTFAGMVAVIYTDPTGYTYTLNATVSTILLTPPDVSIEELRALRDNATVRVSAVLVNHGGTTAQRAYAELVHDGKTLTKTNIGDIDPGTEIPVRLEYTGAITGNLTLTITYYDEYNNKYVKTMPITSIETKTATSKPSTPEQPAPIPQHPHLIVVTATLVFLAAALTIIYQYLKRHRSAAEQA